MEILRHYSLKAHTGFRTDSYADWWIAFDSVADLQTLAKDEYFASLPFITIGEGTNLLFTGDYSGAVLYSRINSVEEIADEGSTRLVRVGSGVVWDDLVEILLQKGLFGAENLSGIPGTVGASAVQNIGAYGAEVSQIIDSVETVDLKNGKVHRFSREDCAFAYRKSLFKRQEADSHVVTHVTYRLQTEANPNLSYAALRQFFGEQTPTPAEVRRAVVEIRNAKLPDYHTYPNAGSFFMNPVVEEARCNALLAAYPDMPHYPAKEGVKLSAAWLIDRSGLKGFRKDAVGTWHKQPLVLVNYADASGSEIADFARFVANTVQEKFDVRLNPEVRYIS